MAHPVHVGRSRSDLNPVGMGFRKDQIWGYYINNDLCNFMTSHYIILFANDTNLINSSGSYSQLSSLINEVKVIWFAVNRLKLNQNKSFQISIKFS